MHVQFQQVANATLVLFVDEIFTVAEAAVCKLGLRYGSPLRYSNLLAFQGDESVLGGI